MKKLLIGIIVLVVVMFFGTEWYIKKNLKTIVRDLALDSAVAEEVFDNKISSGLDEKDKKRLCSVLKMAYANYEDIESFKDLDDEGVINFVFIGESKNRVGKKIQTHCH